MNMSSLDLRCSRRGAILGLLAGTGALLMDGAVSLGAPVRAGDAFPDLTRFGLEGTVPDLSGKLALIDFWASWCGPCKKSFPVMKELLEKYGARGFTVVAVCLDEKKNTMESFLKRNAVSFVVLHDSKGRLAEAVGVAKMPTSFLVSPGGKITSVHSGFEGEATRKEYVAEIEAALQASGK